MVELNMGYIQIQYHKTSIGELVLGAFGEQLCLLDFRYRKLRKSIDDRIRSKLNAEFVEQDNHILDLTINQIEEYLSGERKIFDIPILMAGTDFQQKVWKALFEIPFGETMSYLQLSKKLGNEKAIRAVATANGANAIALIIPCHRVIGSNGDLVGYGGGLTAKRKLLSLESKVAGLTLF